MPITVDERDALRNLVTFTTDELAAAGDPDNALKSLQALTEQRLAEYQATVDTTTAEIYALIDADPAAHDQWRQAQQDVWTRLLATLPINEQVLVFLNPDVRIRTLGKSLPVYASMRWTLTNYQTG